MGMTMRSFPFGIGPSENLSPNSASMLYIRVKFGGVGVFVAIVSDSMAARVLRGLIKRMPRLVIVRSLVGAKRRTVEARCSSSHTLVHIRISKAYEFRSLLRRIPMPLSFSGETTSRRLAVVVENPAAGSGQPGQYPVSVAHTSSILFWVRVFVTAGRTVHQVLMAVTRGKFWLRVCSTASMFRIATEVPGC